MKFGRSITMYCLDFALRMPCKWWRFGLGFLLLPLVVGALEGGGF